MTSVVHQLAAQLPGLDRLCLSPSEQGKHQAHSHVSGRQWQPHCRRRLSFSSPSVHRTRRTKITAPLFAATEGTEASTVTAGKEEEVQSGPPLSEEEKDEQDIQDVLRVLDLLKEKRDMVFNEVRLTVMVEDPREAERKRQLGIDDESGVTREEMGEALVDVNEGRVPEDRLALRALADEMRNWPRLEDEDDDKPGGKSISPYAKVTPTGVDPALAAQRAGVDIDWDAAVESPVEEKSLGESLPKWMGYGLLYGVSGIPIVIGIVVVVILFLNSLQ